MNIQHFRVDDFLESESRYINNDSLSKKFYKRATQRFFSFSHIWSIKNKLRTIYKAIMHNL